MRRTFGGDVWALEPEFARRHYQGFGARSVHASRRPRFVAHQDDTGWTYGRSRPRRIGDRVFAERRFAGSPVRGLRPLDTLPLRSVGGLWAHAGFAAEGVNGLRAVQSGLIDGLGVDERRAGHWVSAPAGLDWGPIGRLLGTSSGVVEYLDAGRIGVAVIPTGPGPGVIAPPPPPPRGPGRGGSGGPRYGSTRVQGSFPRGGRQIRVPGPPGLPPGQRRVNPRRLNRVAVRLASPVSVPSQWKMLLRHPALRLALRAVPAVGLGLLLWNLWSWLFRAQRALQTESEWIVNPALELKQVCAAPNFPHSCAEPPHYRAAAGAEFCPSGGGWYNAFNVGLDCGAYSIAPQYSWSAPATVSANNWLRVRNVVNMRQQSFRTDFGYQTLSYHNTTGAAVPALVEVPGISEVRPLPVPVETPPNLFPIINPPGTWAPAPVAPRGAARDIARRLNRRFDPRTEPSFNWRPRELSGWRRVDEVTRVRPSRSVRPGALPQTAQNVALTPRGREWARGDYPRRPRDETNEVKLLASERLARVWRAVAAWTEADDFVQALFAALPVEVQRRYPGAAGRWIAVVRYGDLIDPERATRNLLVNEAVDFSIAFGARTVQAEFARRGFRLNPGAGLPGSGRFRGP